MHRQNGMIKISHFIFKKPGLSSSSRYDPHEKILYIIHTYLYFYVLHDWIVCSIQWINSIVKNIFKSDTAWNTAQSQHAICICTQWSILYVYLHKKQIYHFTCI